MKRLMPIIIMVVLSLSMLSGCGEKEKVAAPSDGLSIADLSKQSENKEKSIDETATGEDETEKTDSKKKESKKKKSKKKEEVAEISMDSVTVTVYDNDLLYGLKYNADLIDINPSLSKEGTAIFEYTTRSDNHTVIYEICPGSADELTEGVDYLQGNSATAGFIKNSGNIKNSEGKKIHYIVADYSDFGDYTGGAIEYFYPIDNSHMLLIAVEKLSKGQEYPLPTAEEYIDYITSDYFKISK